jgi:probable rRNA maturation factor
LRVIVESELPDYDSESGIETQRWQQLALLALKTENVEDGELSLFFVDEKIMAELNVVHMGKEGGTDVLAFPIDGPDNLKDNPPAKETDPPRLLGDIFVCPSVARSNAQAHGKSFEDEIALLVIHGILHILGHDHAEHEETLKMKERERILLAEHYQP